MFQAFPVGAVHCWYCKGWLQHIEWPLSAGKVHLYSCRIESTGRPNMAQNRIKKAFDLDLPQHKRAQITAEATGELQVIGAGLPRTGTTSLKAAMEILGFDPCHHMSVRIRSKSSPETMGPYPHFPTGALRPSQKESTFRQPFERPLGTISRRIPVPSRPYRTPHARLSRHRRLPGLRRLPRPHDPLSKSQSRPLRPRQRQSVVEILS